MAYGAKAAREKLKPTARLGRPTVQETRQYTMPTRRCTTETKLEKGECNKGFKSPTRIR